jgi:hypothetical protein
MHRPYYQLIDICRLAAALGFNAPGRATRGGGDRRPFQQPWPSIFLSATTRLRLPGAGAFAFPGDASGDRACSDSFARHTPARARLVVKLHPLDSGLVDWAAITGYLAVELEIADRIVILDGGDLSKLLARRPAVVTVNSTIGTSALALGLRVIALGKAVYDIAGLTF